VQGINVTGLILRILDRLKLVIVKKEKNAKIPLETEEPLFIVLHFLIWKIMRRMPFSSAGRRNILAKI